MITQNKIPFKLIISYQHCLYEKWIIIWQYSILICMSYDYRTLTTKCIWKFINEIGFPALWDFFGTIIRSSTFFSIKFPDSWSIIVTSFSLATTSIVGLAPTTYSIPTISQLIYNININKDTFNSTILYHKTTKAHLQHLKHGS